MLALGSLIPTLALEGCTAPPIAVPSGTPVPGLDPNPAPPSMAPASSTSVAPGIARVPRPPAGKGVYSVPVDGNYVMWTVDDGGDAATVRRYAEMARETGSRLVFFPNAQYSGWAEAADILRPMVRSGQVQIGNHTYSHADLTALSDQGIIDELTRNDEALTALFGVSTKPYYRPPFGFRNDHTDAVAATIGFTTPIMWYGSLSDSGLITKEQVLEFANQWFIPGHVVIGHANHQSVCDVFPQLLKLLGERSLTTVTLDDVFAKA